MKAEADEHANVVYKAVNDFRERSRDLKRSLEEQTDAVAALRNENRQLREIMNGTHAELHRLLAQGEQERWSHLHSTTEQIRGTIQRETLRLDYALGEIEGLGALRDEFHRTRRTTDYQRVFDMPEPLVSVCISTLNRSDLLVERAIASLQAQTYSNLQIIIVGDHCTDDTQSRVEALNDPRIEFYNLAKPTAYPRPGRDRWLVAGTGPASYALTKVRGDFFTALDDDDAYEPDRVEAVVTAAQRQRADLVWHKFFWQNPDESWREAGNGQLEYTQLGLGMCLFHGFFTRLQPDIHCYRIDEPGDWNYIRRLKHLRPNTYFIDRALTRYYTLPKRPPFTPKDDEIYLD